MPRDDEEVFEKNYIHSLFILKEKPYTHNQNEIEYFNQKPHHSQ